MSNFNKRHKWQHSLAAAGLLFCASMTHAGPLSFSISTASIAAGAGYGIDNGSNDENGGVLLAVQFTPAFSAPQAFMLASAGERFSFDLATVTFSEPDTGSGGNRGIRSSEQDALGVVVDFGFVSPVALAASLVATGTATAGRLDDPEVDYRIAWNPVEADFGAAGRLLLSINALSFDQTGATGTLRATVELLASPDLRIEAVPEPASFALVGIALVGAGLARRRVSAR